MKNLLVTLLTVIASPVLFAQVCTPAGNETSYGTGNTWIGYIYDNANFTAYNGYVNEGTAASPNFDESFGGDYVNYPTNGCPVYTESFSARYKLTKTFTPGNYQFTVGADDGYRLSIDGGATWIINRFYDQSYSFTAYATTLSGTCNMVIEYYENGGGNRLSFAVASVCSATGDQTIYGTGNIWKGYIYQGTSFNTYNGMVTEGAAGSPNFDENFGGSNTLFNTGGCAVTTEVFSARYRLQKTFASGNYTLTVGGDDGYRLSLDGGSSWVINRWNDQSYNTSSYTSVLNGTYNMVLEYYENGGGNEVSFAAVTNVLLPVDLLGFNGNAFTAGIQLNWKVAREINTDYYLVERSANGTEFTAMGKVAASTLVNNNAEKNYGYTDVSPVSGINYYRLRMVDKDGKFSYSAVIKIRYDEKKAIAIFPSVINHTPVYLSTSTALKNGVIEMFALTGRKLLQVQLPSLVNAGQTITLSLTYVPAGTYVLICKSGAAIQAKQIILIQ